MFLVHRTFLGTLTRGALTLGLLGPTGCHSADAVDDDAPGAAAGVSQTTEKSVTLEKAGDSFTFSLVNVDEQRPMILTIKGSGVYGMGLCASPDHPIRPDHAKTANVKIDYDGVAKYSECEANILFSESTEVKVTNLAHWNDREGNRLTATLRKAVVGESIDLYRGSDVVGITGQLCRVADGCECDGVQARCHSTTDLWTSSGESQPGGFGQDYGFCSCD